MYNKILIFNNHHWSVCTNNTDLRTSTQWRVYTPNAGLYTLTILVCVLQQYYSMYTNNTGLCIPTPLVCVYQQH